MNIEKVVRFKDCHVKHGLDIFHSMIIVLRKHALDKINFIRLLSSTSFSRALPIGLQNGNMVWLGSVKTVAHP